jgi:hypothetical protein
MLATRTATEEMREARARRGRRMVEAAQQEAAGSWPTPGRPWVGCASSAAQCAAQLAASRADLDQLVAGSDHSRTSGHPRPPASPVVAPAPVRATPHPR